MKISPISNTKYSYAERKVQCQNNVSSPNKIVGSDNKVYYGQDLVSFKSGMDTERFAKIVKMESLLSGALARIEVGDFMIVSKTKDLAKQSLKSFKDNFNVPIKALGICSNPDINETFLLLKGMGSISRIWNLSNQLLRVNGFEVLGYSATIPIEAGDRISLGGNWIRFPHKDDFEALKLKEDEFEYYNFNEEIDKVFIKHNADVIKTLFTDKDATDKKALSFDSIGGQDEVIKALKRNVLFPLKFPEAFEGYKLNKGVILYGPPGTGKTLLAKTLGVEANASFFEMCATEMQDMYVGQSEKNCRELFEKAIEAQPSIIFMDEIDALGKSRGADVHGDKLLNQFLHLVQNLNDNSDKVFIVGTTNRLEDIDPALSRSLRMGLHLEVKLPDLEGTKQILKIHSKGKPVDGNLDYDKLAQKIFEKKMSGADIALIVKEAGSNAFERADIYKCMDEGRYTPAMLEYFRITEADFDKALNDFSTGTKQRNPIGYNNNKK